MYDVIIIGGGPAGLTATGDGAIAAFSAQKYVEKIKREVPTA